MPAILPTNCNPTRNGRLKKILITENVQIKKPYKLKNRQLRSAITEEKNISWENKCIEIENTVGGAQSSEAWRVIKKLKTPNTELFNKWISLDNWHTHYKTLFVEGRPEFTSQETPTIANANRLTIEIAEVKKALSTMKNGRSPGPGNIARELLKYGGNHLLERITNLMNMVCYQIKIPTEWKVSHIVSIFKKGNRKDPNCYRGISINSSLSRLYGKIIQNKLRANVGHKIGEDQSGFRPGRSCVDNLFTLQQLLEKQIAVDREVHIAFIDLEKAYDNVPRSKLWEALEIIGTDRNLIEIINELYRDNHSYIKVGKHLSEPIITTTLNIIIK